MNTAPHRIYPGNRRPLFFSIFLKGASAFTSTFASLTMLLCASVVNVSAAPTEANTAFTTVKTTIDGIIEIVEANSGDGQTEIRREKLRALINPIFDFNEMARRSLGAHWKEATPEEQSEFVDVFSDLLAKTYLGKIETVKPGMVKVDQEQVDPPKAVVKTTVTNKGDTFPIDYKLQNSSGSWRVYDVVVENIGLVANYRNEFAGVIRKEKISGLIEKLRQKQDE